MPCSTCIPLRVDHLDFNGSGSEHEVGMVVNEAENKLYIVYMSRQSAGVVINGGIFFREYDTPTSTLGPVRSVFTDNTGAGRLTAAVNEDNRWPMLARLTSGTLVCACAGNSARSNGIYIKESYDNGVSWGTEIQVTGTGGPSGQVVTPLGFITDGTDLFMIGTTPAGGSPQDNILLWRRLSNNSWTGKWDVAYSIKSWVAYFEKIGGMKTAYYKRI